MVLQDCQSGSFTPCCLVVGMDGLGFRVWVEGYLGDKDFLRVTYGLLQSCIPSLPTSSRYLKATCAYAGSNSGISECYYLTTIRNDCNEAQRVLKV